MKENPLVSIIIPNYNHAPFLKERIESVLEQTEQDFELILLDDASTDNSKLILDKYKSHPKVSHLIVNKENSGGAFFQWKKGISLAKGKYIWIAESDDRSKPVFLEKLLMKFNSTINIVYAASITIDEEGKELGIHNWAKKLSDTKWEQDYINDGNDEVKRYLRYRNTIPNASACLIRSEALKRIKLPTNMYFAGDWSIWIQLLAKNKIGFVAEPLNFFRKHNLTTRSIQDFEKENRRWKEYIQIVCSNSTLLHRVRNKEKYQWIFDEWGTKIKTFGFSKIFILPMPLDFRIKLLRHYFTR